MIAIPDYESSIFGTGRDLCESEGSLIGFYKIDERAINNVDGIMKNCELSDGRNLEHYSGS